jgi:hypothetical protein
MENTYGKQTNQVYGTNCQVQMRNPWNSKHWWFIGSLTIEN